jgi:chromosomal replication initiation ATPase DnaA
MTPVPRQIPLDLSHRPAFGREDFMIGPCNHDAVGWIDRWPDWSAPVLVLYGPAGCGKSHLAAVWRGQSKATEISGADLSAGDAEKIAGCATPLFLDRVDLWIGDRAAETTLFHLYNILKERGQTMLLTARMAPAQMEFSVRDLASRLRAAPAVDISPPDDTVLAAILLKSFSDRQIAISPEVISYILPRMERSFAACHTLVAAADALAMSEKKPIGIGIMRRVFETL